MLLRVLPTLGSTALMMATMARCKHPLALPAVLAAIVLAFHAALWALGVSLEQAQEAGWVLKPAVRGRASWCAVGWLAEAAAVGLAAAVPVVPRVKPNAPSLSHLPGPMQASTGNPLHLWRMFDFPLSNLHLGAALAQVGKVRGGERRRAVDRSRGEEAAGVRCCSPDSLPLPPPPSRPLPAAGGAVPAGVLRLVHGYCRHPAGEEGGCRGSCTPPAPVASAPWWGKLAGGDSEGTLPAAIKPQPASRAEPSRLPRVSALAPLPTPAGHPLPAGL